MDHRDSSIAPSPLASARGSHSTLDYGDAVPTLMVGLMNHATSFVGAPTTVHRRYKERERLLRDKATASWHFLAVHSSEGAAASAVEAC